MFGYTFYFGLIRKYVIVFGTLFNDIHITRSAPDGSRDQLIKVPLSYSPKEKMLTRLLSDPDIQRETAVLLPRISFEMVNIEYDPSRKLNSLGKVARTSDDPNKLKRQFNPVPYNMDFQMQIYAKNAEDAAKILEQIIPFFTPEWNTTVSLVPSMNLTMDIPIILNSFNVDDRYTGDFKERRILIWTLNFTLKGYFYGPVKNNAVIKFANTNFYTPDDVNSPSANIGPIDRVTVRPGLDANGNPTSNSQISIDFSLIEATDNFDYITEYSGIILE